MTVHEANLLSTRLDPTLGPECLGVITEDGLVVVHHRRVHADDSPRWEVDPTENCSSFGDNPFQWEGHTGMASHCFFHGCLSNVMSISRTWKYVADVSHK